MKGYYRHILLASAALLAAASCTKTRVEEIPSEPMPISISAVDGAATKALLDNGTFKQTDTKALIESEVAFAADGNRIQVYSYANGGYYFSDLIGPDVQGSAAAEATLGVWPFVNGPHNWSSGTHRFYGWLTKDANSNLGPEDLFGNTFNCVTANKNVTVEAFNTDTQTLTIPAKEMTADTPQFDFMYSDIFSTEPINEPVRLKFSHLFAAYYFSFTNDSAEPLELENVKLSIKSKASASLNYSGTAPVVNIDFTSDQPTLEKTYTTSIAAGKTIDLFLTGNEIASATEIPNSSYRLIWPQDLATATVDVVFSAWVTPIAYQYNAKGGPYNVDKAVDVGAGNGEYNLVGDHYEYVGKGNGRYNVTFIPDARGVYIEYVGNPEKRDVSKSIPLSSVTTDGEWIAGKKYNYNLSFSNDFVDLEVVVMKWDGGHGGNVTFN